MKKNTVDVLALKQENKKTGKFKLIDLFGGQKDLENKLIRAVGNPDERFSEDALRMIRAIRIGAELNFKIEPDTLASIQKNKKLTKSKKANYSFFFSSVGSSSAPLSLSSVSDCS